MYKIKFSELFDLDLIEMDLNLAEYPKKAMRIIQKIDKTVSKLTETPEMYQVYEDFPVFRRIVIEDYLVFYLIKEDERIVEIHRLIYGRKDLKSQFKNQEYNAE